MHRNEESLIERAKRHDRVALTELYERYAPRIYRYICYRVGDTTAAEDLMAEVFLKALEAIGSFTFRGVPFSAWLYRIARDRVTDYFRRQAKRDHLALDEKLLAAEGSPEAAVEERLIYEQVQAAITQLTDKQRQVIILRFIEGLTTAEVAQIMGKSERAVRALQHRALISLQRILRV